MNNRKINITISVDADTFAEFSDVCDFEHKKKSHVLQSFMEKYIANKSRIKKQLNQALKDLSEGE